VTGDAADFELGPINVRPAMRSLETPAASVSVEPLVMRLLVTLSNRAGQLVSREQVFDACWGRAAVGDDSLNRVVAVLRKALRQIAGGAVRIETVAGSGYMLRLIANAAHEQLSDNVDLVRNAVESGFDSWRLGSPETVALASLTPLYGRWSEARAELTQALECVPGHLVALHDLAMLEMATGRVRAAKAIVDELVRRDPLAACLRYKSIYQHWSINDLARLDQVADSAIQLWPSHPAVWNARFWTLAYTGRGYAAIGMLGEATRPHFPEPAITLLRMSVTASLGVDGSLAGEAARACTGAAVRGPTQAVAAMFGLGLLGRVDDLFDVAGAYYLRAGKGPVPMRRNTGEPSINDQHRRVTQALFTPACAGMRDVRSRFLDLCARMGLTEYWESTGLTPDFLAPSA
jgi:DNA-binding winged helix-turn-helix (wHTH) protein